MDTEDGELRLKIRQTAGMVFQNPDNQIVGNLVEEDIAFGPENLGIPTADIWNRVDEALDKTGMEAFRNQSPNHLSGGQKQRVAIAGVLAMHPKCIIFDESTAMLDPQGRRNIIDVARGLQQEYGITILLITHHMDEVLAADHVFVMKDGRILGQGTPMEIFAHEEIDLKNPKTNRKSAGFTDEERNKMTELLKMGFTDTFRYLYPEKENAYSWWSYMSNAREKNVGWRIDYFIVSKSIEIQIQDSMIYSEVLGSDHCPIGLEIKI